MSYIYIYNLVKISGTSAQSSHGFPHLPSAFRLQRYSAWQWLRWFEMAWRPAQITGKLPPRNESLIAGFLVPKKTTLHSRSPSRERPVFWMKEKSNMQFSSSSACAISSGCWIIWLWPKTFAPSHKVPSTNQRSSLRLKLVGGFDPFEKYSSNWIISQRIRVEKKQIFELPPPSKPLKYLKRHWLSQLFAFLHKRFISPRFFRFFTLHTGHGPMANFGHRNSVFNLVCDARATYPDLHRTKVGQV